MASELECRDNQLAYMYYYNLTPLGDLPPTESGTDLSGNRGPFTDIEFAYWSSTEIDEEDAWSFWFSVFSGGQFGSIKQAGGFHVWPIRVVPEPSTALLMSIGLAGLALRRC